MRLVVVLLFACGHPPASQPRTTAYAQLEAALPQALEVLGRLRAALQAAADDCPQMARTLRTFASAHGTRFLRLGDLYEQLDDRERERFAWDHHDERERLTGLFAMRLQCRDDAGVTAAFEVAGFGSRAWIR